MIYKYLHIYIVNIYTHIYIVNIYIVNIYVIFYVIYFTDHIIKTKKYLLSDYQSKRSFRNHLLTL